MKDKNQNQQDREFSVQRILRGSREKVWQLFTDAKHLNAWWGGRGTKNTLQRHEFKVGGHWNFTSVKTKDVPHKREFSYVEIQKLSLIVMDHINPPRLRVQVKFEEVNRDQTKVSFQNTYETQEQFQKLRDFVIGEQEEMFDRLENQLLGLTGQIGVKEFKLSRDFKDNVENLWMKCTKVENLKKWWGDKSVIIDECKMDFKRGGGFFYTTKKIQTETGEISQDLKHCGQLIFRDIVKNRRLIFLMGESHIEKDWPKNILMTLNFEKQELQTHLNMRLYPINCTEEEVKFFNANHLKLKGIWSETFDRLDEFQ
jgi:uncharacterized protein YndB with AHSA1/START domain